MFRSAVELKVVADEVGGVGVEEVHEVVAFPKRPEAAGAGYTGPHIQHQRPRYATAELEKIAMQQQQLCC